MALQIDDAKVALIERFLGLIIRQVPSLAIAAATIAKVLRGEELTEAEMAIHHGNVESADAELQAAINKRLGR